MVDLSTTYMGLELRNPVVMGSCGLVSKVDGVKKAEDAGAGAIVLKSLFEEQIRMETAEAAAGFEGASHPEARAYIQTEVWMRYGPRDYCTFVEEAKKAVDVPVIASVNCASGKWWTEYAKDLEAAGADALEANILVPGTEFETSGAMVEKVYLDAIQDVTSRIKIPVAAKIGFTFASLANMTRALMRNGAKALVLFNRFYRPDIDIEKMRLRPATPFSVEEEMHLTLRWIGLLSGKLGCDFAATTGIHDAEHVIKQILAGANVAQVCSTIYKNQFSKIGHILEGLEAWMVRHDFNTIDDFRGILSHQEAEAPAVYERRQYIKHLTGIH